MAEVETTIDSIRDTTASPERTLILKQKQADNYLPFWISPSQADILVAQLKGEPEKDNALSLFLSSINGAASDIKYVPINLENNIFHATIMLSRPGGRHEAVKGPIGVALALAVRSDAPILVDEAVFGKAGVCFPPTPCEPLWKESWWRRLFKKSQRERAGCC